MIEIGLKHISELTVTDAVTAITVGSGDMPVLATPMMMALMENAAMLAVKDELPEGCTTVGGHIESSHLKPSKIGDVVKAEAEVTKVDGKKIEFKVSAYSGDTLLGEGSHLRFIVDRDKFLRPVGSDHRSSACQDFDNMAYTGRFGLSEGYRREELIRKIEHSVERSALPLGSSKNYKIVTLCGSTRFKEQFIEAQKRLTLDGCIVISVGMFGHSGDEEVWKPGVKDMLDDMHLRKIDLADEIFVINVGGYIGESTRREIAYAEKTGKKVNYLEENERCSS